MKNVGGRVKEVGGGVEEVGGGIAMTAELELP